MCDFTLRSWKPEDTPRLKELWKLAFGDSDEYIDSFYRRFVKPETCVVAEADGAAVSAMYILPGARLYPYRRNVLTAGYTYALATQPVYRGQGIGSAVYKAANDRVLAASDAAIVRPAEASLFSFYEYASGARPLGGMREDRLTREELRGRTPENAARVSAVQYAGIREWYLSEMPHATFPEELYEHMEDTGTEFFMLENGAAAAETSDGVCRVLELLSPQTDYLTAAAGIARWCPAGEYIIRTPLFFSAEGEKKRFTLAAFHAEPDFPLPDDLWWGFGLD